MLVTFNPRINTGSDVNATYMNFLRCVRAICTAAAGTSSLIINPFTNNTGTIDNTRNCIISIDANTEAGGWTESASSNVVQSGSFTAIASASHGLYKFDCFNASGKGSLPFNKMTFHSTVMTGTASGTPYGNGNMYKCRLGSWASYPYMQFTYGSSTTNDWTGNNSNFYVPASIGGAGYPNYDTQRTSWTMNVYGGNDSNVPAVDMAPMFYMNNPQVNYRIAVTANYCIIWEVHTSNSYTSGFSNLFTTVPSNSAGSSSYGGLIYMGLRETQAWENSRSDNPPWVAMQIYHTGVYSNGPYIAASAPNYPTPPNNVATYMATINDSGIPSATAQRFASMEQYDQQSHLFGIRLNLPTFPQGGAGKGNTSGFTSKQDLIGITTPLWQGRNNGMDAQFGYSNQLYMPTVDTTTGTGVPSAYPIVIRTMTPGLWNAGGAIRGLYKSLTMPIATMRNYFAGGQTFSIYNAVTATTDTYLPIVFAETMYLVRYA
jgi:hypothetical protein